MRWRHLAGGVLITAAQSASTVAIAQTTGAVDSLSRNACVDAIPDSALHRVPVYLTASLVDSVGPHVVLQDDIDLLTQSVAYTGRALLGAAEGALPPGDPSLGWRGLTGEVLVVARRNGAMSVSVVPPRHPDYSSTGDAGLRFVARALDTALARGERLVFPESLAIDSVRWRLRLKSVIVDEAGVRSPPKIRMGIPIFSVAVPTERPVAAERVQVRYPPALRRAGFMGRVLMQFVVDTTGRVDRASVRDLYPPDQPPLTGSDLNAYTEFIRAIRDGLDRAWFRPARLGGCTVRQLVQQPFDFKLGGGFAPQP